MSFLSGWAHVRVWLCLPLSLSLLLGAGMLRPRDRQAQMEQSLRAEIQKDFVPVFRFAIASDAHICDASYPRNADRFAALFRTAYRYSDAHPTYRTLDAVLLAGDVVNSGADEEYAELNRVVRENMRDETQFITVMGNHEYGVGSHEAYMRNMHDTLDKHIVIKGFHIIGLSTDPKGTRHTLRQVRWMNEQLREASADDPEKPIFTMQHGHIWNTVYVSRSWFSESFLPLHAVYAQYPQVVNFSGHSHGPVNHPFSIWQSGYTAVGTGTMHYFEMERDISDDTVPEGSEQAAQYLIVEVDAENRVRILPFNILTDDFFKTPSTTDDPDTQLVYQISRPSDRSAQVYTAARRKTNGRPWFASDAGISVETTSDSSAAVTFDQAQDNVCVYGYRIQVAETAHPRRTVLQKEIYSEYYFEPMPETLTCVLDGLTTGKTYTVRVIPLNVWRQTGAPLETEFTMQKPNRTGERS